MIRDPRQNRDLDIGFSYNGNAPTTGATITPKYLIATWNNFAVTNPITQPGFSDYN